MFLRPINLKLTKSEVRLLKSNSLRYFRIYRWNPYLQIKPHFSIYPINLTKCGSMILDVLIYIKNYQDATLTFRRSCREGICGSCSMNIEGVNGLACLKNIPNHTTSVFLTIYPLPHLQIIKDLVPDLTNFYRQYSLIKPWLISSSSPQIHKEHLQSFIDRSELDGLYECILCACCSASCPSYWWNSDKYLGPSILLQAYRWIVDSRDSAQNLRIQYLSNKMRLFSCHSILNCTSVCPKALDPAKAIQKLKFEVRR